MKILKNRSFDFYIARDKDEDGYGGTYIYQKNPKGIEERGGIEYSAEDNICSEFFDSDNTVFADLKIEKGKKYKVRMTIIEDL